MRGNIQKSLNSTGTCCVIEIDDLEKHFIYPFRDDYQSYRHRAVLCKGFRKWLVKVKSFGLPLEIWINGSFVTEEALPKHVDVVCVLHYFKKALYGDVWNDFDFFTQKHNGFIQKEYHCSVELPILNYEHIKYYSDLWFGRFQRCAGDGVFKIIL